jgi:hypothetical protein
MTIDLDTVVTVSPVPSPAADQRPVAGVDGAVGKNRVTGGGVFPGIADYAFLSDCETNCLIAPSGSVEWMCLPRPDSPSVFSTMLDRGAGSFRVVGGAGHVGDGRLAQHRRTVQDAPPDTD